MTVHRQADTAITARDDHPRVRVRGNGETGHRGDAGTEGEGETMLIVCIGIVTAVVCVGVAIAVEAWRRRGDDTDE